MTPDNTDGNIRGKANSQANCVDNLSDSTPMDTPVQDWKNVPWKKIERNVYKLQKRIYRASSQGNVQVVRKLQKVLLKSWSAKMLAVRQVTQDNQGKKTAGVDGVKSLIPNQRLLLVEQLKLTAKGKPTRRVWIPKPGTDEKRPLGIPTMSDRALQALVKLVLEPEWEAKFEPNSYGFRPGRSCHDALVAIFNAIRYKSKFVLDADIAKCFDRINHTQLLKKLNTFPAIARQIRAWLKAGTLDHAEWLPTDTGTPQGGVISPLLANIALHGMELVIKDYVETIPEKGVARRDRRRAVSVIRYADDFVILHKDQQVIQGCQQVISAWLAEMGLELKPSKTRLTHTLEKLDREKPGFNFLGFNIRQYPQGKHHVPRDGHQRKLTFQTIIKPSNEAIKAHLQKLSRIVDVHRVAPQEALISHLNPVIRGWCNYYSTQVSKKTFSFFNSWLWWKLIHWVKKRHPHQSMKRCVPKYWHMVNLDNWRFSCQKADSLWQLTKHTDIPIIRHVKVRGNASPFDGNLTYWSSRMGKHPEMPKTVARLLKRQKGKCNYCGHTFRERDRMERDHILPKSQGGKDEYNNFQLLHRHCHDRKTAADLSLEVCMTSTSLLRSRMR